MTPNEMGLFIVLVGLGGFALIVTGLVLYQDWRHAHAHHR